MSIQTSISSFISSYIYRYGDKSLSYCIQQPCLSHFIHQNGVVAYAKKPSLFFKDCISVLGDPLCEAYHLEGVLKSFLTRFPNSHFFQINDHTASVLRKLGYYSFHMGIETHLDLKTFFPTWSTHRSFKRHLNQAKRAQVVVKELPLTSSLNRDVEQLSQAWLFAKPYGKREQAFLTRPLSLYPEKECRYFFAYYNDTLVGIRFYYPLYRDHHLIGYYNDICRIHPNAPSGTSYLLADRAITIFQKEGVGFLSLGLSPFEGSVPTSFIETIFSTFYHHGSALYNFQGLSDYKQRFHSQKIPCYFSSRSRFPILGLYAGLVHTLGSSFFLLQPKVWALSFRILFNCLVFLVLNIKSWIDPHYQVVVDFLWPESWQSGRMRRS